MSSVDLRVEQGLELLASFKDTVSSFAKKEEQLLRGLQSRRFATTQKFQNLAGREDESFGARIAEAELFYKSEEERVRTIYAGRRARTERFHAQAVRTLPKRAHQAREDFLGGLQMKELEAERKRDAALASAAKEFSDFRAKVAESRNDLVALKKRARASFTGYWTFSRRLKAKNTEAPAMDEPDRCLASLQTNLALAGEQLDAFDRQILPRIFRFLPIPILTLLILAGGGALAFFLGKSPASFGIAGGATAALLAAAWGLHHLGWRQSKAPAFAVADVLEKANQVYDMCRGSAEAKHERDRQRIQEEFERAHAEIAQQWNRAGDIESEFAAAARKKLETKTPRISARIEKVLAQKIERIQKESSSRIARLRGDADTRTQESSALRESEVTQLSVEEKSRWDALEAEWKQAITPLYQTVAAMNAEASAKFPAWSETLAAAWTPPAEFNAEMKFARFDVDVPQLAEAMPKDPRLALPGPAQFSVPLALTFPQRGSLLFETNESGGATVIGALNNVIVRLLATTPPGKIAFTIIDPVGLGQNFAGLMHLSDYEESLINRRIWTQHDQIETRLAELNEHIEKVIQMYLRNEYATITEYNAQAGSVAEKYHFLIIADFPAQFTETAARRLQSIATSGPRCGVFTLIHWDQRLPLPDGFVPDELRKNSVCVRREKGAFVLDKKQPEHGVALVFDPPPAPELELELVHKIGKSSIDSNRVEVPFSQIAPKPDELWTNETTNELKVAIGRTGATKLQYLAIGKGTRQHALFAGKTGSGKSTLFHVIITNLALACSPEQVEFYLIDFKKGVEFKCYAEKRLPHARVIAIESDREFGLSVLQRVDEELKRRGDMFRKLGVQDVAGYKRVGGAEPMPRTLLIIDEFQEFFVEDDTIAQGASLLFDRIVRQGRAFGIHVLLGSQTLGGAYTLARATLGQMVIRVALQCNEADAYLIMDDNNSAPRLLSRPGEGIYNDAAGAVEGNSPFQVVWLPDEERDEWLGKVREVAEQHSVKQTSPIVFEGNAPADVRDNDLLRAALAGQSAISNQQSAMAWLGAPNSIKGPTEAKFARQSGNNLLIVGQREEAALTMLGLSLLALAAQFPSGSAHFIFLHGASAGSPEAAFIEQIAKAVSHDVTIAGSHDVPAVMTRLSTALKSRMSGDESDDAPFFFFIHGLHKFKKLRHEDDFSFSSGGEESAANPGAQFNELITEGSTHGMHILTSVDTFNNVGRFISRKALTEFEMRVVFQMSANDSASLIDSPKASNLGLHRALFYNERESSLETFRPYAPPEAEWLRKLAAKPRISV